ncbi:MAG: hypothetical protein C5B59_08025 [Bacteroidetes bacterium]|nr:MAG: hypothetical protein C5B59_08025 [Bacteroidota bacterium]
MLLSGNRIEHLAELSSFRDRGEVVMRRTLQIPADERIPMLTQTKEGRVQVLTALSASLKSFYENISLKEKPDEYDIVLLASQIIDESHSDNLSVQDVLLFLGDFLRGKYGPTYYNKLDMPTFFNRFENYRQKRHEELLRAREEQQAQYKAMGRENAGYAPPFKLEDGTLDLMQTFYEEQAAHHIVTNDDADGKDAG